MLPMCRHSSEMVRELVRGVDLELVQEMVQELVQELVRPHTMRLPHTNTSQSHRLHMPLDWLQCCMEQTSSKCNSCLIQSMHCNPHPPTQFQWRAKRQKVS